ncbi:MAG TPA: YciI-like protein [Candidatus Acidoferrales bacterium]
MNYYALFYEVVGDFVARRVPFRQEHLRLAAEAHERGEIVFAGALAEPADRALIVFHVTDKSTVEAFARKDPYVVNGLVQKWEVRPWNVVIGNERPSSSASSALSSGTILRRWTSRTTEAKLPKYLDHFSNNVVPELRRVPGYLGATVSLRRLETEVEIVVETNWRSLESIRNFAGPDLEAAVVADQAAALLTSFDRRVLHSEIVVTDRP